jgi:hypothetical protein
MLYLKLNGIDAIDKIIKKSSLESYTVTNMTWLTVTE